MKIDSHWRLVGVQTSAALQPMHSKHHCNPKRHERPNRRGHSLWRARACVASERARIPIHGQKAPTPMRRTNQKLATAQRIQTDLALHLLQVGGPTPSNTICRQCAYAARSAKDCNSPISRRNAPNFTIPPKRYSQKLPTLCANTRKTSNLPPAKFSKNVWPLLSFGVAPRPRIHVRNIHHLAATTQPTQSANATAATTGLYPQGFRRGWPRVSF